jgi:hypothetical protein
MSQLTRTLFDNDMMILTLSELRNIAKVYKIKDAHNMNKNALHYELSVLYKTKYNL